MTRTSIRRAPSVERSPAVEWALLRAFAAELPPPGSAPAGALDAARQLDLSTRIAARLGRERLSAELAGSQPEMLGDYRAAASRAAQLEGLAGDLASVADSLSIPIALLKFAALHFSGVTAIGSRRAGDVDILVAPERLADLASALLARGYRRLDMPGQEHHAAPLVHPAGISVDLHRRILGVHLGRGGSATVSALEKNGLLSPAPGLPEICRIPAPEILAAHAIVHGLAQHRTTPRSYPLTRMLADISDLGGATGGVEALLSRAAPRIARDVSESEMAQVAALVIRLSSGSLPRDSSEPGGRLLDHVLAGALVSGYQESLKLDGLIPLSDKSMAGALAAGAVRSVFLTRGQVDAIYGRPASSFGYLGRRLLRPFDLVRRLAVASLRRSR